MSTTTRSADCYSCRVVCNTCSKTLLILTKATATAMFAAVTTQLIERLAPFICCKQEHHVEIYRVATIAGRTLQGPMRALRQSMALQRSHTSVDSKRQGFLTCMQGKVYKLQAQYQTGTLNDECILKISFYVLVCR